MKVVRLSIDNFRGIRQAQLDFDGHTLLVGGNNVGKSTVCEALELVLGPDRLSRNPVVEEFDFYNAGYLNDDGSPRPCRIEVILTDLTDEVLRLCARNLEHWHKTEKRLLAEGELALVDTPASQPCLRILGIAQYNPDEDEFEASAYFAHSPDAPEGELTRIPKLVRRSFGFLYLRALRTGSRALSLERGSLLDVILRMKQVRTGLWEDSRKRLRDLDPPIDRAAEELAPVLESIENRLAEYIPVQGKGPATRLFVSQLTREHLRKTITFFLSLCADQEPVPFHEAGTGTLNILVLALLSFIAEIKKDNVIFAMEEPEIAVPPHTQRRIANYLLEQTSQCFVSSHSPYVIERFEPEQIMVLTRDETGILSGKAVDLSAGLKAKTYRKHVRRAFAEVMLGRGVIVAEGITEQLALGSVAQRLEASDANNYPLDLSGVTIITCDGDGSISEYGAFFRSLGVYSYAFLDKKDRSDAEEKKIGASFDVVKQTAYKGCEALIAQETPLDRQWEFLESLRQSGRHPHLGIPPVRPGSDDSIRELTVQALKSGKGEGSAAELVERCCVDELPMTMTGFLADVYSDFPRPKAQSANGGDSAGAGTVAVEGTDGEAAETTAVAGQEGSDQEPGQ
jgi:putative ATP-dependent endonuclease of OLD family